MSNDGAGLKVDPFALALVSLLYVEHLLFGASQQALSLLFAVAHLALLLALIVTTRGAEPPRLPLKLPAILFGAVFALAIFSLLPLGPPLAHPMWSYVQPLAPKVVASVSLDPVGTRVHLVRLAGFAALFLAGAALGSRREGADQFARYLCWGGILYCLWAGFSWKTSPNAIFGVPRSYGADRLGGSFLSANTAGTLFASLTVLGLMGLLRPFMRERREGERLRPSEFTKVWPQLLLVLLAMTCLLLSASRGGLLALVAATLLALALLIWIKSSRQSLTGGVMAVICLALFAGVALFAFGGQHTAARLAQGNPLDDDRLQMFAAYWKTIKASPWLGYGLGAFSSANAISMTSQNAVAMSILGSAHNVYLQWLLQMGWTGAACMFAAVGLVVAATVRGVVRRASQQTVGLACIAIVVVFAVHGLVDFALEVPSMAALFSVVLGLGYGIAERPSSGGRQRRRRSPRSEPAPT
jgi:O-antigen ligase